MKLHLDHGYTQELEDMLDAMLAEEFKNLEPYWLPGVDLEATEYAHYVDTR